MESLNRGSNTNKQASKSRLVNPIGKGQPNRFPPGRYHPYPSLNYDTIALVQAESSNLRKTEICPLNILFSFFFFFLQLNNLMFHLLSQFNFNIITNNFFFILSFFNNKSQFIFILLIWRRIETIMNLKFFLKNILVYIKKF